MVAFNCLGVILCCVMDGSRIVRNTDGVEGSKGGALGRVGSKDASNATEELGPILALVNPCPWWPHIPSNRGEQFGLLSDFYHPSVDRGEGSVSSGKLIN